jgi:hypothetical protein
MKADSFRARGRLQRLRRFNFWKPCWTDGVNGLARTCFYGLDIVFENHAPTPWTATRLEGGRASLFERGASSSYVVNGDRRTFGLLRPTGMRLEGNESVHGLILTPTRSSRRLGRKTPDHG